MGKSERHRWKPGEHVQNRGSETSIFFLARNRLISPHDFWEGVNRVYLDDRKKGPFFQRRE